MNTDIRIDWQSGMEITPQTFIDMENNIAENRMLVRKMISAKNFGVIPRTKFTVSHELTQSSLHIKQLECSVLLPTGQVIVVESGANINLEIPPKDTKELYLTVELGSMPTNFSKGGIPYVVNEYKYDLKKLSEIRGEMPLLKIANDNDTWKVSETYVMPVMAVRSSTPLMEKLEALKKSAVKIIEHDHAAYLTDSVLIMVLIDQLATFSVDDSSRELVLLCKRISTALSFSIYKHKSELPAPNIMDIEPYLDAFTTFLADAAVAMNDLKATVAMPVEEEQESEPPVEDVFCPMI